MHKTCGRPAGIVLTMVAAVAFGVGTWGAVAATAASTAPNVMVAQNTKLGNILTDNQGMTLYVFKKDEAGKSACAGPCAKLWPPLAAAEGTQPVAASGISGTLGQIERKDDTYQVTYNGIPLYRYAGDNRPGDTNGQGFNGLWSVVQINTSAATARGGSKQGW